MRWKTDHVCETRFATQKKVKLTGSCKTNVFNQKRQEWTAKTPAQAAPRPEAEEVFWSLPTPWGRRASLGNSTGLSPCWSSWRRWRCLWWWRSTRRSPWPASTTCPTGSTWSGCRQTLTRQTWRTPQTRKRVFLLLYIADIGEIKREKSHQQATKLAQYIWFNITHQNRNLKSLSRPDTWGLDTATPSSRLSSKMVAAFCNQNYAANLICPLSFQTPHGFKSPPPLLLGVFNCLF